MLFSKEKLGKLLLLKEKVQKTGSAERERQQIITAQLSQLETETEIETATDEETVIDEETVVDDIEPSSPELPELPEISVSNSSTSVVRGSKSGTYHFVWFSPRDLFHT